jgi:hypothetical protein
MIWHPMVWAFGVAAMTGGILYLLAAFFAVDVAANWAPDRFDEDQLKREHRAETSSLLASGAFYCLAVAALLGLLGVCLLWHRIVPGAMCGTGVLQAMGSWAKRALFFWVVLLVLLYAWNVSVRLERSSPQGQTIPDNARLMLIASPFLLLALFYSQRAIFSVDMADPVSCCAAVYDQVLSSGLAARVKPVVRSIAFWGSLAGSVLIAGSTIWGSRLEHRKTDAATSLFTMVWALLAAVSVSQIWSAYYYQVLSHPCPWCLFLPDYWGAGFLIFGCIAVVALEGAALWTAQRILQRFPDLRKPAIRRCRKANARILAALVGYSVLTLSPALHWRMSTGVWLSWNHFY